MSLRCEILEKGAQVASCGAMCGYWLGPGLRILFLFFQKTQVNMLADITAGAAGALYSIGRGRVLPRNHIPSLVLEAAITVELFMSRPTSEFPCLITAIACRWIVNEHLVRQLRASDVVLFSSFGFILNILHSRYCDGTLPNLVKKYILK